MEKDPSQYFLESINALSYNIEQKYGQFLENFDGDITHFDEIRDLLHLHLHTSLISPLRVIPQPKKVTSNEQMMINRALEIMKEKNTDHFFVSSLHGKKNGVQAKNIETILNLIQKRVFKPIARNFELIKKN